MPTKGALLPLDNLQPGDSFYWPKPYQRTALDILIGRTIILHNGNVCIQFQMASGFTYLWQGSGNPCAAVYFQNSDFQELCPVV